ncbi:hypothetical protein K438DRAFT_460950 [Mycena galopus ATCC 62051]|nr:hypothetical protein K438DRAFT_460950 [Mycena galopus ATCC 62051]
MLFFPSLSLFYSVASLSHVTIECLTFLVSFQSFIVVLTTFSCIRFPVKVTLVTHRRSSITCQSYSHLVQVRRSDLIIFKSVVHDCSSASLTHCVLKLAFC